MSNKKFIINNVTYYPSSITPTDDTRGKEFERADGSVVQVIKRVKKKWALSWNLVPQDIATTLSGLCGTSFPVTDAFGSTYSGIIKFGDFNFTHDAANIATNGTEYFVVNLTITEV